MNDDRLRHLCKLGVIQVGYIRTPDFVQDLTYGVDRDQAADTATGFRILAEAFVELVNRAGMKPKF